MLILPEAEKFKIQVLAYLVVRAPSVCPHMAEGQTGFKRTLTLVSESQFYSISWMTWSPPKDLNSSTGMKFQQMNSSGTPTFRPQQHPVGCSSFLLGPYLIKELSSFDHWEAISPSVCRPILWDAEKWAEVRSQSLSLLSAITVSFLLPNHESLPSSFPTPTPCQNTAQRSLAMALPWSKGGRHHLNSGCRVPPVAAEHVFISIPHTKRWYLRLWELHMFGSWFPTHGNGGKREPLNPTVIKTSENYGGFFLWNGSFSENTRRRVGTAFLKRTRKNTVTLHSWGFPCLPTALWRGWVVAKENSCFPLLPSQTRYLEGFPVLHLGM